MARALGTAALGLLALVVGMGVALAAPLKIKAEFTDLTSNTERMISYRHQEHLWQTADGGLHLIFNRGTLSPSGLTLYSSYDGGNTWQFRHALANTNDDSTADGNLEGNVLSVVFQNAAGEIGFVRFRYDSVARNWQLVADEIAFSSTEVAGINPALGIDAQGTVWASFPVRNRETDDVSIRMIYRPSTGTAWWDTGQIFGPTDHRSIERSARPVRINGGMGMVFTVREVTYWAERSDAQAPDSAWAVSTIHTGIPEFRTKDPYGSHFSVVADAQRNVHLALIESYDALYFRRPADTGTWTAPTKLDDDKNVVYLQVGLSNGKVVASWSVQRGLGSMVVSPDGGTTFKTRFQFVLPPDAPGVSYGTARVEIPTRVKGNLLPMLQEYQDNGTERLLLFKIPAP